MGRHRAFTDMIHAILENTDEHEERIMLVALYHELVKRHGERRARLMLRLLPDVFRMVIQDESGG